MRRPFDDESWAALGVPRRVASVRRVLPPQRRRLTLRAAVRARLLTIGTIGIGCVVGIVCAFLLTRRAQRCPA